jgi:hypothetical protein
MRRSIGMFALCVSVVVVVGAQTRTFEVASIKRNTSSIVVETVPAASVRNQEVGLS